MLTFSLDYDLRQADPKATLFIAFESIERAHLSIAARAARNRTSLYQRKHIGTHLATREREPALAAMNRPIDEHYRLVSEEKAIDSQRPVVAFAISDLTANPLRPHYDAEISPEDRALTLPASVDAVYRDASTARLFHLEDEPIGKVPYTLLICHEQEGRSRLAICHDIMVAADGALPNAVPAAIRTGLKWWAACPPLLRDGEHSLEAFALRDYDVRHVFGFPMNEADESLADMYLPFPDWDGWCTAIRERLRTLERQETGYHAALGVSRDGLIVLHRIATIPELARELQRLGAEDAVLLDSGGSCAIWANWANGGDGGMLASQWNFRPPRGAVALVVLKGNRLPELGQEDFA